MQCLFMTSVINFVVADKRFLLFHFCPNKTRVILGRCEGYDYAHVKLCKTKILPFHFRETTIDKTKSHDVTYILKLN